MTNEFPDDADGEALRELTAAGHNLSEPMEVDFQVAAADEESATKIAEAASKLGYRTAIYFDDEEDFDEGDDLWTTECTKEMVVTYEELLKTQTELDELAKPLGGYIDGWGTFGNAEILDELEEDELDDDDFEDDDLEEDSEEE